MPIGVKLGVAVVLVVMLASVAAFLFSAARERDALVLAKQKSADMVIDLFAESLRAPLDFGDADAVATEIGHLNQNQDLLYASVWHGDDTKPLATLGKHRVVHVQGRLADLIEVQRRVKGGDGKPVGHATLQFSLARENAEYLAGRQRLLSLCLLMALGTVAALLTVTRTQVVKPVDALLSAVRRLEKGERDVEVVPGHNDEIGRLARGVQTMAHAIHDREDRLAEALGSLRELFDHMRQAILVFDRDGLVVGTQSREAAKLFGREKLEGAKLRELLYPERGAWDAELKAFDEWLTLAFYAPANHFSELLALAPPEVKIVAAGGERVLALEFRPIAAQGLVQRIMLLATDETDKRRLAETVVAQGQSHARQMAMMQRLVAGGGQQFVAFLRGTRDRLSLALGLCAKRPELPLPVLNECFGHVHTLRGEARVFGLEQLAQHLLDLEATLHELRAAALAKKLEQAKVTPEQLEEPLRHAERLLAEAERLFVEASPIGRAVLEQVTVPRPDLEELCLLASGQGGRLAELSERLGARGLGELLAPFPERTGSWAESVNKRARLEVVGREVLIPEPLAKVLGGAVTHLVRNAIAHGIESPEERERKGKPAVGVVTVGADAQPGQLALAVWVEDDGIGLDANPLLAGAADRGRALDTDDAEDGSFRKAAASADSELAGRGMGLTAALRDLEAAGFKLSARRAATGGARFEIVRRGESGSRRISA